MIVTLELKPDLDSRLRELAMASGISLQAYLVKLIEGALSSRRNEAAVELLAKWAEEDATRSPEELDKRRGEWESLKKAMNERHSSDRVLFP
jgi:predicted transcriptional regulator